MLERFLEGGDPCHGFARIYCDACGHDNLLASARLLVDSDTSQALLRALR